MFSYVIYFNERPLVMRSHERHAVSNHPSFNCLFNRLCGPTPKKLQSPLYWPFVRGIHQWPVNSPHKGSVTLKIFTFHDVIKYIPSQNFTYATAITTTHVTANRSWRKRNMHSIDFLIVIHFAKYLSKPQNNCKYMVCINTPRNIKIIRHWYYSRILGYRVRPSK